MRTGHRRGADPREVVEAPVIAALDGIILRAAIGFSSVAALATLPLLVRMDEAIHQAVHLALPVGWLAYAALTAGRLAHRSMAIEGDPWQLAREVDRGLARFARVVSAFMLIGWLASVVAVWVHHHLSSRAAAMSTLGTDVPLRLVVWSLAALAWSRWCRAWLARAENESGDRLREYWSRVGH